MATEPENISMLLNIAACAVELDDLERRRYVDEQSLSESYRAWKHARGIDLYVDRDSAEWQQMQQATAGDAGVLKDTKRQVANARRRLRTAINRFRKHGSHPSKSERAEGNA